MEETTMNLGNVVNSQQSQMETTITPNTVMNVGEPTLIVSDVSTTVTGSVTLSEGSVQATTIPVEPVATTIVRDEQPITQQIQAETVQTQSVQVEVAQPNENANLGFQIKTETLINMVNNGIKAAICNNMIALSEVFQLKFDKNGLEMVSTDGKNTLVQRCTDVSYTQDVSLCVSASLFTKLINKLDTEYVELIVDEEKRILIVKSNGEFILKEVFDTTTGQAIVLDTTAGNILPTDAVYDVDVTQLVTAVEKANSISGNNNLHPDSNGVCFTDRVLGTNHYSIFTCPNVPQLQNEKFFLPTGFVALLLGIKLSEPVKFVLRKDATGNVLGVIVKTDNICLFGPADTIELPLDVIYGLVDSPYNNSFVINKNRLISVFEKAALFISPNDEKGACKVNFDAVNQLVNIQSITKSADQIIPVVGLPTGLQDVKLDVTETLKVLKNFNEDEIKCIVDTNNYKFVKLTAGDIMQVLTITD